MEYPGYCFRGNRPDSLTHTLTAKKGNDELNTYKGWDAWIKSYRDYINKDDRNFFEVLSIQLGTRFSTTIFGFSHNIKEEEVNAWIKNVKGCRYLKKYIRVGYFDSVKSKLRAIYVKLLPVSILVKSIRVWDKVRYR